MKPSFALALIICAYLAPVLFWPHAVNTAVGAAPDTPPAATQKQAAGKASQPRSLLLEALEIRAREEAARQIAGTGKAAHRDPGTAWDRERAFAGMERLRAEIVLLGALPWRTTGAASVEPRADQDRQGVGRFAAAPLPGDAARRLVPIAAGDLRCGQPGRRSRSAAMSAAPAAENTPPTESGNSLTKDELQ